jgi:hypothetical protein
MGTAMIIIGSVLASRGVKYYDDKLGKHFIHLDGNPSSYAVIVFIYIFVASFAYSWGPVNMLINLIININWGFQNY